MAALPSSATHTVPLKGCPYHWSNTQLQAVNIVIEWWRILSSPICGVPLFVYIFSFIIGPLLQNAFNNPDGQCIIWPAPSTSLPPVTSYLNAMPHLSLSFFPLLMFFRFPKHKDMVMFLMTWWQARGAIKNNTTWSGWPDEPAGDEPRSQGYCDVPITSNNKNQH